MNLLTYAEMAELVQNAISGLLTGQLQSYTIGGKSFNRLNLKELNDMYLMYRRLAEQEAYGPITLAQITSE